ncbi:hypothetical protein VR41_04880 [Streptomyces sp. NRRL B-1568]|nr:hypothetical protein VR41_04880 [Streptomyces sp. NRRL B-1568]
MHALWMPDRDALRHEPAPRPHRSAGLTPPCLRGEATIVATTVREPLVAPWAVRGIKSHPHRSDSMFGLTMIALVTRPSPENMLQYEG